MMKFSLAFTVTLTILGLIIGTHSDDKLSPIEKLAVKQFHEMVKDGLTQEMHHADAYLIRWIRARNFDLRAAEEMIRRNFEWRKENRIDNVLNENFDHWKKQSEFVFTYDYDGRPGSRCWTSMPLSCLNAHLGQVDIRRSVLAGEQNELDRYIVYGYERGVYEGHLALNKTGKTFIDGYLLFNLAGYSARSHACLACISTIVLLVQNYERYYPQLANKIFLIHTPRIFEILLNNILRPLMSPHTAKALLVYGYNKKEWKAELLKIFPESQLLPSFGGTFKGFT